MKVALYVPSWPPGQTPNGIVTYASYVVPALQELGHEVFILTFNCNEPSNSHVVDLRHELARPNILDHALRKLTPNWSNFRIISSAIAHAVDKLVSEQGIEVFEIEESFGWSAAVSRLRKIPVVVRLHGPCFLMGQFEPIRNRFKIRREGFGIRHADYITACCNETLSAVRSFYNLPLIESKVISNPISSPRQSNIWQVDQCDNDSLLYIGRFDKVKGGDIVLRAFARLSEDFPTLTLTFVGPDRGFPVDNCTKLSFQEYVQKYIPENARNRIIFRSQLTQSEVTTLRASHFLTIIAARYDIQGYVMMEAMSHGCPLVATAVGGIPEVITDHRNGLLAAAEDPDDLAKACKSLLQDKDLAARIAQQARLDCLTRHSPKKIAQESISAYCRAIQIANHSTNTNGACG